MPIDRGASVPSATLKRMPPDGSEDVELAALPAGRKVVLFGVPGAFTRSLDAASGASDMLAPVMA